MKIDLTGLAASQIADIEAHLRGLRPGPETYTGPEQGWTCFHCGETFLTNAGAALHFGTPLDPRPGCVAPDAAGLQRARSEAMRRGDVAFNRADAIVRAYLGLK